MVNQETVIEVPSSSKNASYQKFKLGETLTDEQIAFFDKHGFIHFDGYATKEEVTDMLKALKEVETRWIQNNVEKINGTPIKYGKDVDGSPIVHRFAFTSLHSDVFHEFASSPRLKALKKLLPKGARIAENEKDGVVVNHYLNSEESNFRNMGWHTDSLRDVFLGKKIMPMLNIGFYFDDSSEDKGGLRVIPGTHKQGLFGMLFKKMYFLNNDSDKEEVLVSAKAGDLVIHDGRIWHRVARSPHMGEKSRRRVMYFPMIVGKYQPKNENSKTPIYHYLQRIVGK